MNSMEINKIVGAVVGALLIYLGVNFFSDMAFFGTGSHGDEHQYAYALEVEADDDGAVEAEPEVPFAEIYAAADVEKGKRVFGKCKSCHKIDGGNGVGPHLDGVVNRDIASIADYGYSGALEGLDGDWTPVELSAFLEKPKEYAPGTKMSFAGLKKPGDRADLIAYLALLER
jgi:cytochrome c